MNEPSVTRTAHPPLKTFDGLLTIFPDVKIARKSNVCKVE